MKLKYKAYWLHESGVTEPVETDHLSVVINKPELFSFSQQELKSIIDKYDEDFQRICNIISNDLIKNRGWIRINYKGDCWNVHLHTLTDKLKNVLTVFFTNSDVTAERHSDVVIFELYNSHDRVQKYHYSLSDLYEDDFFREKAFAAAVLKNEQRRRTNFVPYLMRVGTETRPSSIAMAGFFGLKRCFLVGSYPKLLNVPLEEQLKTIKEEIAADRDKDNGCVPFFGKKIGYAFHSEYETCIALSLDGNILEDVIVHGGQAGCSVSLQSGRIVTSSSIAIPRFVERNVGLITN